MDIPNDDTIKRIHHDDDTNNYMSGDIMPLSEDTHKNNTNVTSPQSFSKLRWKMLRKALLNDTSSGDPMMGHDRSPPLDSLPLGSPPLDSPPLGSTRHFNSFELIRLKQINTTNDRINKCDHWTNTDDDAKGKWYMCTDDDDTRFCIEIRLLTEKIPLQELLHGFDNTGNICLWPSEEILAYYCRKNQSLYCDKIVCEIGGGMTCLSGLVTALSGAKEVILTDGNHRCIDNVNVIIKRNAHKFGNTKVVCKQLKWGNDSDMIDLIEKIDVILCSDCLYFDEGRQPLIDTIYKLLNDTGIAVILAPTRGNTFQDFIDRSIDKFQIEHLMIYDSIVWQKHQYFLRTINFPHYTTDLHYPRMIVLRKKEGMAIDK